MTPAVPDAPEGLHVEAVDPKSFTPRMTRWGMTENPSIAYRADCHAHEYCRTHLMRWCADSWEDLRQRVFPLFLLHCQEAPKYGIT